MGARTSSAGSELGALLETALHRSAELALVVDGEVLSSRDLAAAVRRQVRVLRDEAPRDQAVVVSDTSVGAIVVALAALLAERPLALGPADPPDGPHHPPAASICLATSGTTGRPKWVQHDHRSILAAIDASLRLRIEVTGEQVGSVPPTTAEAVQAMSELGLRYFCGLPFPRIGGFTTVLRALLTSAPVVLSAELRPASTLALVGRHGCTNLGLTPFLAQQVLRQATPEDLAPVVAVGLGGAYVPAEVVAEFEARGVTVTVGYGSTESAGPALMTRAWDSPERRSGIGRPVPGARALVIDARGRRLEAGMPGELLIATPSLSVGYLGGPPLPVHEADGRRWWRTGDRARELAAGSFEWLGRLDDVIQRSGLNIDPRAVEAVLDGFAGVRCSYVFGEQSRIAGEQDVVAVIEGHASIDVRALRRHCADQLSPVHAPRHIVVLPSMPRTVVGDIDRSAILAVRRGTGVA